MKKDILIHFQLKLKNQSNLVEVKDGQNDFKELALPIQALAKFIGIWGKTIQIVAVVWDAS